jgi:hypothetical protein
MIGSEVEGPAREVDHEIRRPARSSPIRAVLLTISSRLASVALVAATALLIVGMLGPEDDLVDRLSGTTDIVNAPGSDVGAGATSFAKVMEGILLVLDHPDERLLALAIGKRQGRTVDARLVVTVRAGGSTEIDRLTSALGAAGLDDLRVRSVVPVPAGSRLELSGSVVVTSDPLPTSGRLPDDRIASRIAELVASTGASLTRLDIPVTRSGAIRLSARGPATAVVDLLRELEARYSAPLRIDDLRIESGSDGNFELFTTFRLRTDVLDDRGGS